MQLSIKNHNNHLPNDNNKDPPPLKNKNKKIK